MEAKVKRALVFGSAPIQNTALLEGLDLDGMAVYCADGGMKNARLLGLTPDFAIGDWDSGGAPAEGIPCVSLPPEKDMTDLQAALDAALSAGVQELILCGCMGGPRLDHTASNLVILEWLDRRGGRGLILDEDSEVRLADAGTLTIDNREGIHYRYFSLIPLDREVRGVSLEGAKYPLNNADLTRGDTFTVSNEPSGPVTRITIGEGRVLVIRSERLTGRP